MIDWKSKNKWVMQAIEEAGHSVWTHDFVEQSTDDVAVQTIIDSYDAHPEAKLEKIKELKIEGLRKANLVYDPNDDVFSSIVSIKLLIDIDNTYTRSGSPAARLVAVNQLLTAFENAVIAINNLNTLAEIEAYNVTINPAW